MVGHWLLAIGVPGGWFSIVGPFTITLLILKVPEFQCLKRKWPGILISQSTDEEQTCFFLGFQRDKSVPADRLH